MTQPLTYQEHTPPLLPRSFAWLGIVGFLLSVWSLCVSAQETDPGFDEVYEAAGKPRVIVFMSEDFATLLSDWSLDRSAPRTASNGFIPDGSLFNGFARPPALPSGKPRGVGDFHDQLMARLSAASIRVVDHQSTLGTSENVDHQEMVHVGRHAEILTELIFVRDPGEPNGFAVQIRAMRAGDGRYLGSRRIAAPSPSAPGRLGWRTGDAIVSLLSLNLQR